MEGIKKEVMHINDFGMICEECQETGHTGTNCPELAEDINYISNTTTITILSKTKARTLCRQHAKQTKPNLTRFDGSITRTAY